MLIVLILAIIILLIGRIFSLDKRFIIGAHAVLFGVVILINLILPTNNMLRQTVGGSVKNWIGLFVITLIIFTYVVIVKKIKNSHINSQNQHKNTKTFKPEELNRYARHIVLREIGGVGQKKLKMATILVVGAGGLGSPVLQYLASCGVGTVGVIDNDLVDSSNLQRQVIHSDVNIGKPKVFSASEAMKAQNPFVEVLPYNRLLNQEVAADLFEDFDLILDGSDNAETRYLVNRTCVALKKPLISGAITQWEGQIAVFDSRKLGPCYQCIFPVAAAAGLAPSCSEAGVVGALPGVIGSIMVVEAIKLITGAGESLNTRLLIYDALFAETRVIKIKRDPSCPVCSKKTG